MKFVLCGVSLFLLFSLTPAFASLQALPNDCTLGACTSPGTTTTSTNHVCDNQNWILTITNTFEKRDTDEQREVFVASDVDAQAYCKSHDYEKAVSYDPLEGIIACSRQRCCTTTETQTKTCSTGDRVWKETGTACDNGGKYLCVAYCLPTGCATGDYGYKECCGNFKATVIPGWPQNGDGSWPAACYDSTAGTWAYNPYIDPDKVNWRGQCPTVSKCAGKACDGNNLNGAACPLGTKGTPTCTSACTVDYSTCQQIPVCLGKPCPGTGNPCETGGIDYGNGVCVGTQSKTGSACGSLIVSRCPDGSVRQCQPTCTSSKTCGACTPDACPTQTTPQQTPQQQPTQQPVQQQQPTQQPVQQQQQVQQSCIQSFLLQPTDNFDTGKKTGTYKGNEYTWTIKAFDSSTITCPTSYQITDVAYSGFCDSSSTGVYPLTTDSFTSGGKITSFTTTQGNIQNVFKVHVKPAGGACTLIFNIKSSNGATVDPGFTVIPPSAPTVGEFDYFGDKQSFTAQWAAFYTISPEKKMNVECGLNCDPTTQDCSKIAGSACLPYPYNFGSTPLKQGSCTVTNPVYDYSQNGNKINCLFYDPDQGKGQFTTVVNRAFKAYDFKATTSSAITSLVGTPFGFKISIANVGLFSDKYKTSVTSAYPQYLTISTPSTTTGTVSANAITSVTPSITPLVDADNTVSVTVSSTICDSCPSQTISIPLKSSTFSLPEFGIQGFIQIMILAAGLFYLFSNVKIGKR